jgi:hypothetical protein
VSDLLIFIPLVAVVLVAGIGVGMLVGRRLDRLMDRDEEPRDD